MKSLMKSFMKFSLSKSLSILALNLASASIVMLSLTFAGSFAHAVDGNENHPRRQEVNDRFRNERMRIKEGVKNGSISKAQAKQLRGELKELKMEERADLKAGSGHLSKEDQEKLNQKQNDLSKQIGSAKSGSPSVGSSNVLPAPSPVASSTPGQLNAPAPVAPVAPAQ